MEKWREEIKNDPRPQSEDMPLKTIVLWLISAYVIALMAMGLVGLISLGYQVLGYLRTGQWTAVSLLDALKYFGFTWATKPVSWVGAHKILDYLPMWGLIPASIFIFSITLAALIKIGSSPRLG
ncbi:hypothetical protein [Phyllobacterium calauticae]|uniref:hypothetical protein n=1 Tax=Phyllobacterium calauticae TaxID=2817027 RepID=UPI001CBE4D1D|nr:hypothetical protein [Phyllobacterium calauticae]MBZ3693261.1 hypothetical protein [Phyllobacterium calauticae]